MKRMTAFALTALFLACAGLFAEDSAETLKSRGLGAFKEGRIAQGLKDLVTALRLAGEASALGTEIRQTLDAWDNQLTLEPSDEWVSPDKSQKTATTSKGMAGYQAPAVILSYQGVAGPTVIPGVTIRFQFQKGQGSVTEWVSTNDYGKANAALAELADPLGESVIRASLVIQDGTFSYAFKKAFRDFSYQPEKKSFALILLINQKGSLSSDKDLESRLFQALKNLTAAFVPIEISGADLKALYGGETAALEQVRDKTKTGYLFLASLEAEPAVQMQLNGKLFNIFKQEGAGVVKVYRLEDRQMVYSFSTAKIQGQGASGDKSLRDLELKLQEQLVKDLSARQSELERIGVK